MPRVKYGNPRPIARGVIHSPRATSLQRLLGPQLTSTALAVFTVTSVTGPETTT